MSLLVSLADMKSHLGILDGTYDAFLTTQITTVSDSIENYCGRIFASTTYTQTFYGEDFRHDNNSGYLFLFHYPIISIVSAKEIEKVNSSTENTTVLTSDFYRYQNTSGKIYKTFENGSKRFWFTEYGFSSRAEIQYTAGYANIPSPIQDVVFAIVSERYNKKVAGIDINFGNDIQRLSIPGVMSIDFDYTLQANERKIAYGMILGNYTNVLDGYRSERPLVGEIEENYVQ